MISYMKNDVLVRRAEVEDLEDILRLNSDLVRKEYKEYDKSLNLEWTQGNEGKKYFRDSIVAKNKFVEVAEKQGRIVGYLCGGISERLFYRKKAKYAELENMLIEKSSRGGGMGTQLTEDFIRWCKKNRVSNISVSTSALNKKAIDFYRKIGFKDYTLTLEIVTEPQE